MNSLRFGKTVISSRGPAYVIAEIGHNHQGNLKTAMEMIRIAANNGANAVKFQKRDNQTLFTKALYNKPYDNENSFGLTYGEHREFLEFDWNQYLALKECARKFNVDFMCTAFDFKSVDFLEKLGITTYKVASGDLTNTPLLDYIARKKKPVFLSTGASTLEEIHMAYDTILKHHDQLCLMHTTCTYPTDYADLNLRAIITLKNEFPKALIGYSGHDNGILAAVLAYNLGAVVIEKHFTLNRSSKGTDHNFSLEPEGLRKQIRDLHRADISMGDGKKIVKDIEAGAKTKMGKSLYTVKAFKKGHVLSEKDIGIKSPAGGLAPYYLDRIIGKKLRIDLPEEGLISLEHLEEPEKKSKGRKK